MRYDYSFKFDDGTETHINLVFDKHMKLILDDLHPSPKWTRLCHKQCENCPLMCEPDDKCPAALTLHHILENLQGRDSNEEVLCEIITPQRTYKARVPMSVGLGSCLGLALATSSCPVLDLLRPMAHLHLPFATASETYLRNMSLALMGLWLREQRLGYRDKNLKDFHAYQEKLRVVNTALCERLRTADNNELGREAVLLLDIFAEIIQSSPLKSHNALNDVFESWLRTDGFTL